MKQNLSILRLSVVLLAAAYSVLSGYANGDPVVRYSSINRVANPEPLSISEISIVREDIKITHEDGYNCFDITYQFENRSDKDFPAIDYGFPIDYLVEDEQEIYGFTGDYITESIHETGWNEKLIKDISFLFNGETLPFQSAKESVREAGYDVTAYEEFVDSIPFDGINRRWFYTQFAIAPHSEAQLIVRYKVYANKYNGLYSSSSDFTVYTRSSNRTSDSTNYPFLYEYFSNNFTILYDFTPAKHFGNNNPFSIYVDIDLSNLINPVLKLENDSYYTSHIVKHYYFSSSKAVEPIVMMFRHSPDKSKINVERIIEPFIVKPGKYKLVNYGDSVIIDFNQAIFVSDIVCEVDTNIVKSIDTKIQYKDGRSKEYFNRIHNKYYKDQIYAPIILTITDFLRDGYVWVEEESRVYDYTDRFDDERFKIKSIKLIFNHETYDSGRPIVNNIRVLDARFDKRAPE